MGKGMIDKEKRDLHQYFVGEYCTKVKVTHILTGISSIIRGIIKKPGQSFVPQVSL